MKKPILRILGTSVTLIEEIRKQAEIDLGIKIEYQIHDPETAQRIAVLSPDKYDLYDQWFHNIDFVWPVKSIQPIEISKIKRWNEINDLAKKGTLISDQALAKGGVPCDRLYIQEDGTLGSNETNLITMLPLTHNVDSFVYFPNLLPENLKSTDESWSWLLDENWKGSVAVQNDAAIGGLDLAMAVQSSGKLNFQNVGNLALHEIDALTEILKKLKQQNHFKDFWADDEHAYQLISNKEINIGSLWYPALIKLLKNKKDFRIAKPKEGYRAWFGGLALSRDLKSPLKEVAYDYLNWWLEGWAGSLMARQGLYISNPLQARKFLKASEWDYWYMGKPAAEVLYGVDNQPLIEQGSVREGGSYIERMGHIGVWNSVMDEHNYLVRKWNDLVS
ncbi:TPA: extracellular solute-binding protein [Acinetobacter baumannii]|uniref:Signal peptide prediction n=1 Tax=Acinetobacter baumannii NIPH 80 TaxID=1217629 RepID=N9LEK5_ACIBA|nr:MULTISPECIES: extracellular solute-binding protein [Acinetobacter calcoaceticus/baumannii complex]ENW76971.1 hypothetical protein F913_00567 [Acinetobacter baumannii NIPH 80]MDE9410516.1 extracellular solute-binding protein [Acinetobacter nosocomialis]HDX5997921.1 extracellular solute-binding protein [Acinetobacter baumannii]